MLQGNIMDRRKSGMVSGAKCIARPSSYARVAVINPAFAWHLTGQREEKD